MKKNIATFTTLLALLVAGSAHAYKTPGDGRSYTLQALAADPEAGITTEVRDGISYYTMTENDTIAPGDSFRQQETAVILMADDVTFVIEGGADLQPDGTLSFLPATADAQPIGLQISNGQENALSHCTFDGPGLRFTDKSAATLTDCTFRNNNGRNGQAALLLTAADVLFNIEHCTFADNPKAAIASAANISPNMVIAHSTFENNGTQNGNTPQLNLTAAKQISITDCTVTGSPEHTMVGGIGVSNFFALQGTNLSISQCTIQHNRYGIGTVGPVDNVRIEQNTLFDNCHETNPMNGGSGISLYDPYLMTTAVVSGNHIEGSLWGVTIIGCRDVNLGQPASSEAQSPGGNVFKDNGFDGQRYDLYNNSSLTVYAQNNTWNVPEQTQEEIERVIFHKADDATLGEVIFWPAATPTAINGQHLTPNSQHPSPNTHHPSPNTQHPSPYYDLNGRAYATPQKGINVIHGKKVVY